MAHVLGHVERDRREHRVGGGHDQILGPHTEHGRAGRNAGRIGAERHSGCVALDVKRPVADHPREEVHRRAADEGGHKPIGRPPVDFERCVNLLDQAVVHEHDPVAEGHRLDLVVRHVDHRGAQPAVQPGELGPHLHPELGIEIREGLVEQKHLRLADDRPAEGHPLPLAPRELPRPAGEQVLDRERRRGLVHPPVDLGLRGGPHLQAEGHVLPHGEVGIERVVLKHHRDVAVAGGHVVDHAAADRDLAGGDLLEARHHPQGGRFAAAGGPYEHEELAVGDVERDPADGMEAFGIVLVEACERDGGHGCEGVPYSFTEPTVSPLTRYLLNARNTATTGMLTRIEAAA